MSGVDPGQMIDEWPHGEHHLFNTLSLEEGVW